MSKRAKRFRQAGSARRAEQRATATGASVGEANSRQSRPEPLPQPSRFSRKEVIAALLLGVMVVGSYVPAMLGGFVWDDTVFTEEPLVRDWDGIWKIWISPGEIKNEGHYWPLVYSSFWLEHKLWGFAPMGYHVVNVLLHALICVLLWRVMLMLAVPGAWLIAAVFAVHPLHVESVAWVIERKDLLSGLFYLAAIRVWLRFTDDPNARRYFLALGLFGAAMLSKSIAVTLPVALAILVWWKRGMLTWTDARRLAPFFGVAAFIALADLQFYQGREEVSLGYSLAEQVLIASRALWFYAGKLIWPTDLAVIYPHWEVRAGSLAGWAWPIAACALAGTLWLCRHRIGRGPLAGLSYFAVTLAPVLGFVDYGYMQFSFVADRYQYLGGIGVIALVVGVAVYGAGKAPSNLRIGLGGVAAIILALLASLTWRQAGIYRDPVTFFSHIVSLNPLARDAHLNLCAELIEVGRAQEGLDACLVAKDQRPEVPSVHANSGLALIRLGRYDEAGGSLRRALEIDPKHRIALQNTAVLLMQRGDYGKAVDQYRETLAVAPDFAMAHGGLGEALFALERHEEAIAAARTALDLRPAARIRGALHRLLGRSHRALERFEAAERHFRSAMELEPQDAAPLFELSRLRREQQRPEEAEDYLRRARELLPSETTALQRVAEELRKQGLREEALAAYRAVLELDPDYAFAHGGMGHTLFDSGRYEEAAEAMATAISLREDLPMAAFLHVLIGRASKQTGRLDAAVEHFQRAIELDPHDTDPIDRLALLHYEQRRYEDAHRLYQRMLEIEPDNVQAISNLAATQYYLGRTDEAIRSFERAFEIDPNHGAARSGLEQIRALLGGTRQ